MAVGLPERTVGKDGRSRPAARPKAAVLATGGREQQAAQVELGQTAPGKNASGHLSGSVEARDEVAKKVGLGSGRTYERAKQVIQAATVIGELPTIVGIPAPSNEGRSGHLTQPLS